MNRGWRWRKNAVGAVCVLFQFACTRWETKEWHVTLEDQKTEERVVVGSGLANRVVVSIREVVLDDLWKPKHLTLFPDPGVNILEVGDGNEAVGTVLNLTVLGTGWKRVELISDDVDEKGVLELDGRELTGVQFGVGNLTPADGGVPRLFAGTRAEIQTQFMGRGEFAFNQPVHVPGTAPLEIVSPDGASALLQNRLLTLGDAGTYVLKTAILPDTFTIQSYDLADIASLRLQAPSTARIDEGFVLNVAPLDSSLNSIAGTPPAPFEIEVTGAPITEVSHSDYSTYLRGSAVGTSSIQVGWGSADAGVTVDVTAN